MLVLFFRFILEIEKRKIPCLLQVLLSLRSINAKRPTLRAFWVELMLKKYFYAFKLIENAATEGNNTQFMKFIDYSSILIECERLAAKLMVYSFYTQPHNII